MKNKNIKLEQVELAGVYKFLLYQSSISIANFWLKERIEKDRALEFIRDKGLLVEFMKKDSK